MLYIALLALGTIVFSSVGLWLVLTDSLTWKATRPMKVLIFILWFAAYLLTLSVAESIQ